MYKYVFPLFQTTLLILYLFIIKSLLFIYYMDSNLTLELRKRFNSSMTYQEYLDVYDKPPPKPKLKYETSS